MKTIALRFSDNYAPKEGMIFHHQNVINQLGYVWYGKFGNRISKDIIEEQLESEDPKFLLIKSGGIDRYWVHFDKFQEIQPPLDEIPEYYRNSSDTIKCWFRITKFEKAEKDVLSKCYVLSSGDSLSIASKHSMNPYFKRDFIDERKDEDVTNN